MADQRDKDIEHAADRLGLSATYIDARGREVAVSPEILRALIEALSRGDVKVPQPEPVAESRLAYQGEDTTARHWLLAVQLYGVRSRTNWGHGDFTDLRCLLKLAAELGAAGIGVNPLHALMHDSENDVSPYFPSSRLFLNFLYIDIEALPEFKSIEVRDLLSRAEALRGTDRVDYAAVVELKQTALRRCFEVRRFSANESDLAAFRAERGESLQRFAQFAATRRLAKHPSTNDAVEYEMRFQEYVQWHADRQLRACSELARELGLPIGLYLDVAVGVRPDGADVQADPEAFLKGVSVGAPPDLMNAQGQDWGLSMYHPIALAQQNFEPFRRMLATNMQYAGAIRLDHVLWMNRLFIIPSGVSPVQGSYIRYPLAPLLTALADESNSHRCIVIGEDLGTVPPDLRAELRRGGVWTYHVMQFERDEAGGFKDPAKYEKRALATFSTHDLPPFAAWHSGSDIVEKRAIGLDPGETAEERETAKQQLDVALADEAAKTQGRFLAVVAFLARTPSRLVAVGLEDALGLSQMTNIPGTMHEHPNWRMRLPIEVEDLVNTAALRSLTEIFGATGRSLTSKSKSRPGS